MRRPHAITAQIALAVPALCFFAIPQFALACGAGFSSTGGSTATVTSDSAESFTPASANLFGDISNLGSSGSCRGYLLPTVASCQSWSVPADWTSTNVIQVVGAGGNGAAGGNGGKGGTGDGGGGGGEYEKWTNQALSGSYTYRDDGLGALLSPGATCGLSNSYCASDGNSGSGTSGGAGGAGACNGNAVSGYSGYDGGTGAAGGGSGNPGGGGGGAAGPNGAGAVGSGSTGGTGDNGSGGTGACPGNNGTEWDSTHGSGGGGNGGSAAAGCNGGSYGAGGGGGQGSGIAGGVGGPGLIVITYTPSGAGGSVTQHGFAYSTDSSLSTGVSTTTLGSQASTGSFKSSISGLSADTTYYYRAYATNGSGTSYGSILSFTTGNNTPARKIRLFEGYKIKFTSGRVILYGQ